MADAINFASLQKKHESLLQKQQNVSETDQQDFIREVKEYIEKAKAGGAHISSTRDRDQLRANLRYWANYIYSVDKTFPDTELAPSSGDSRPVSSIPLLSIAVILLLIAGGYFLFNRLNTGVAATNVPTTTPISTLEDATEPATEPPVATEQVTSPEETETATPEFSGINVSLNSPTNGEYITPKVSFTGTYDNLEPGWTIHVLLVKGDKYFPLKDNYHIPNKPESNNWTINSQISESPDEMSKAQSYSVVLVVSRKDSTRELLTSASQTGIEINALPDDIIPFNNTARVIYRNPFYVVQEPRILYSDFDGISYDLHTSRLDGSDSRQITFTQDIDEMFPGLSPDGTKIVYVKRFHRETLNSPITYTVSVMDGNGQNDSDLIEKTTSLLESTQWSPDANHISYVVGDISQSPTAYSISIYDLTTKEVKKISPEFKRRDNYKWYSWIPGTSSIIFNVGMKESGTAGLAVLNIESTESPSVFFDGPGEDIQPRINIWENGYLLTFILNNDPSSLHDIYMAVVPAGELQFNGTPVRLIQSTGEDINSPTLYPETNSLYYTKYGSIYRAEYQIIDGEISLVIKPGVRSSGVVVVQAKTVGDKVEQIFFDVNFMDTFFEIK